MAERIEVGSITITAGTLSSAPMTKDVSFKDGIVDRVELVVPDGCNGLVGFALQAAHQQVIPWTNAGWIIANDEVIVWPLDGYISSGSWQLIGYNTDVFDHTIYARFLITERSAPGLGSAVAPIVIAAAPAESAAVELLPPEVTTTTEQVAPPQEAAPVGQVPVIEQPAEAANVEVVPGFVIQPSVTPGPGR